MCVVFLALETHPRWRVVLAANRDETYARPTAPAGPWPECSGVIAGRDLTAGGTWLGATHDGRWTVVTNVRDIPAHRDSARSRGALPAEFLCGDADAQAYARQSFRDRAQYNPFNLLLADREAVWYVSTHRAEPETLAPGIYGLSNATLGVPWPKVSRGRAALAGLVSEDDIAPDDLFAVLRDAEPAPDEQLPETGVGLALERTLSSIFISSPDYGTRASSVLLLDREGGGLFVERTTTPGASATERTFTLHPNSRAATL